MIAYSYAFMIKFNFYFYLIESIFFHFQICKNINKKIKKITYFFIYQKDLRYLLDLRLSIKFHFFVSMSLHMYVHVCTVHIRAKRITISIFPTILLHLRLVEPFLSQVSFFFESCYSILLTSIFIFYKFQFFKFI